MIKGIAINFNNKIARILIAKKTYRILLAEKSQVLNFRANKESSAFNRKELMMVTPIKNH